MVAVLVLAVISKELGNLALPCFPALIPWKEKYKKQGLFSLVIRKKNSYLSLS